MDKRSHLMLHWTTTSPWMNTLQSCQLQMCLSTDSVQLWLLAQHTNNKIPYHWHFTLIRSTWIPPPPPPHLCSSGVTRVQVLFVLSRCHSWNNSIVPWAVCVLSAARDLPRRKYFLEELMGIMCPGQVHACWSYQKIRGGVGFSLVGSRRSQRLLFLGSIRLLVQRYA